MEQYVAPTIDHCSIRHSQLYGVWAFNGCSPTIVNSIFEQNHGAEVAITGSSFGTVRNCFLRYSAGLGPGAIDDGVVYTVNSGGVFRRNRIAGVGMALYCLNSSSPTLVGQNDTIDSLKYGRNDILDFHYYGIRTEDEGLPELGSTSQGTNYLAGRNNLFSTAHPSALWILHTSTVNQLSAKHNFWGAANPDPTRFSGDIAGPSQSSLRLSTFDSPAGPSNYYPGYQGAAALTVPEQLYGTALGLELSGDSDGAVSNYRALVTDYPEDPRAGPAYTRLANIQLVRNKAADELSASGSLSGSSSSSLGRAVRRLRPTLLASIGEWDAADTAYDELIADPSYDHAGILFEVALQKGLGRGDVAGARDAILQMQAASPDYHLIKHARAMLQDIVGSDIWLAVPEPQPRAVTDGGANTAQPMLEQNYPNPLNPRTTFAFTLPNPGRVRLAIFDVQGRLVRTIVDGHLPAGRHELGWDGTTSGGGKVASGVYFYRLSADGKNLARKLITLE